MSLVYYKVYYAFLAETPSTYINLDRLYQRLYHNVPR